jgi:uncharacterized protein
VESSWRLGNLRETPIADLMKKRLRREFNDRKEQGAPGCASCEWNFICRFGCSHYRLPGGENFLCDAYRQFFSYTHRRFETLKESLLKVGSG